VKKIWTVASSAFAFKKKFIFIMGTDPHPIILPHAHLCEYSPSGGANSQCIHDHQSMNFSPLQLLGIAFMEKLTSCAIQPFSKLLLSLVYPSQELQPD